MDGRMYVIASDVFPNGTAAFVGLGDHAPPT
jgi:hypothetical protein